MTRIVPLSKETHKSLKVDARASAAYGDNQRFTHVVANEFPLLVVHYPILFAKDANTGEFNCGVMLGFDEVKISFSRSGANWSSTDPWACSACPSTPMVLTWRSTWITRDVGVVDGTALFTEFGEPSRYLQRIIWAFQDLNSGIAGTRSFITGLLQLKLIEPIVIEAEFDDGRTRECDGLYTVSQETLKALPDQVVVDLFRLGYLRLIHLMLASLKQIPCAGPQEERPHSEGHRKPCWRARVSATTDPSCPAHPMRLPPGVSRRSASCSRSWRAADRCCCAD